MFVTNSLNHATTDVARWKDCYQKCNKNFNKCQTRSSEDISFTSCDVIYGIRERNCVIPIIMTSKLSLQAVISAHKSMCTLQCFYQ